jgi:hypothetical protein
MFGILGDHCFKYIHMCCTNDRFTKTGSGQT